MPDGHSINELKKEFPEVSHQETFFMSVKYKY